MEDSTLEGLQKCDRFLYAISRVPQLPDRMVAFTFVSTLESKLIELKPDIESVAKATEFIKNSDNITRFLKVVLLVGNFMNTGNRRLGGAFGFKITTLKKLGGTKTPDGSMTLLAVMVKLIMDSEDDFIDFTKDELQTLSTGARGIVIFILLTRSQFTSCIRRFEQTS